MNNKDEKFINFFKEYMMQISIKDLFICDIGEIIKKINTMYALLNRIEKLSIIDILDEFIKSDIYQKRNIIIVLLINELSQEVLFNNLFNKKEEDNNYDELLLKFFKIDNSINDVSFDNNIREYYKTLNNKTIIKNNSIVKTNSLKLDKIKATKYAIESITRNLNVNNEEENLISILSNSKKILNANILMDYLKNNILKTNEYENFLNSIHWNFRKKIFAKNEKDLKNKNLDEVSWETKLTLLEISEKTKEKVFEKIKEVRSSKDNSKAETFVDGFFKIPFGKLIIEDIFLSTQNSNNKIKKMIQRINKFIDDKEDKINTSDTLDQFKNKTLNYRIKYDIENDYYDLINEKKKINNEKNQYLEKVDKVLEDAIHGHKESKREIKRILAQWMSGKINGAILGFHGPIGVGKTSFAKKGIAKCLFDNNGNSRPFCMFQLGGALDGTILEGHSYTYVGAKPGRLVEFLQESKCMNPIIYFDELDKVSETDKGREIINILIHLTDKSQNSEIQDKYFSGIELDFSKCIIIFSYNDASKVNRILRDRITEIKINPLTKNDKVIITNKFTLKEISDELNYNCKLSNELIEYIIDTYTMEAGVRKLNEKLYEIFRELNLYTLENPNEDLFIDTNLIDKILSRHYKINHYKIHLTPQIGLINGLYASTIGIGGITLIQIKKNMSSTKSIFLELTGQQGDVMKESMQCAKTLALDMLTSNEMKDIHDELKKNQFGLHIHCPDGATPKDGPSAGIAITTGIYSVLTNKPIRNDIAMTGEVDLLGNVKAIGGLDAKINGAIKAGVKLVIFPKENRDDWEKIQKNNILEGTIDIFMAETIHEVIAKAIIS